ncbi:MAG: two-component system, LytTR family, response regulator [Gammaproteobacteria bacterium]|jgi:two-component system LytT family response regulator|nr:two-component system, LytTR family, response regulator [Gammaproteobacteria bacterium]
MKAMIIDDEPPARRELRRLLSDFSWVDIVGEAGDVEQAAGMVESLVPELLFLDIQMPGGSGFDLLARLEHLPEVIFTTAHDEHAVRAFEVDALDYLLKPIDPARLAEALARVKSAHAARELRPGAVLEQIFVRDGTRCWFVPLREVRLLSSEGNYIRLSWGMEKPLLGRALAALEQRLDPNRFFRANRRQIINLDFIDNVELGVNGRLHAQLRDGPEVEISRRQARLFKTKMSV